jgi:hypothetical protein
MTYDFAHAIVSGALLYATYWAMQFSGALDGKTKGKQRLLLAVAFSIVILVLNLLWPAS